MSDNKENKCYWLSRISIGWPYSKDLLEKGFLTIGWEKCAQSKDELIKAINAKDWDKFREIFSKYYDWSKNYSLALFLQMKPGDIVLIPLWDRKFAIAEIVSNAELFSELNVENKEKYEKLGFSFYIKLNNIIFRDRKNAHGLLQRAMQSLRRTTHKIEDIDVIREIDNSIKKPVVKSSDDIIEAIQKWLFNGLTNQNLEYVVKSYMKSIGATIADKLNTNDPIKRDMQKINEVKPDADVHAWFENLDIHIYIQVKRFKGKVEDATITHAVTQISSYINSLNESKEDMSAIGWVITSATEFTEKAQEIASSNSIRLIDGRKFAEMILEAGLPNLDF